MKHVFVILFALCLIWSVAVYFLSPSHESDLPIMHWVTDRNPVRGEQIDRFLQWMEDKGHGAVELRLDTSNSDISKKVIQGVSGVGADLMDLPSDQLSFFVRMGVLEDLTEQAKELGFDTSHTYKALKDVLIIDGRQYGFPANIDIAPLIINVDQFEKVGIDPPKGYWNIEEFETQGLSYVRKANEGLPRQLFFFSSPFNDRIAMTRGLGGSFFNETLTASNLNSPEYIKALTLLKRWIDLGITPSAADVQSMATDSGYGGANFQLFNTGNYAMMQVGRHAVIQLRLVGDPNLSVIAPPADVLPNVTIRSRVVAAYRGGRHRDLAPYFLAYLASEAYNETVVDSGDALPPDPAIALTKEYSKPEGRTNEWDFHKHFADFASDISIAQAVSPYVLPAVLNRFEKDAHDAVMANMLTAEQAADRAEREVQREIERTLHEHVNLQEDYDLWVSRQQEIDRLKAEGKKIPAELIRNPFHLVYYSKLGLLEETPEPVAPAAEKAAPVTPASEKPAPAAQKATPASEKAAPAAEKSAQDAASASPVTKTASPDVAAARTLTPVAATL